MTYYFESIAFDGVRHHPYEGVEHDPRGRLYDFKASPELIPNVLEEFVPHSHLMGVQSFYSLLRWLNGPESVFESSDSRFDPPEQNQQTDQFPKQLVSRGSILFFYRDLSLNCGTTILEDLRRDSERLIEEFEYSEPIRFLVSNSARCVTAEKPHLVWGCVQGFTFPSVYSDLEIEDKPSLGHQIGWRWWSWGDDVSELDENFQILIQGMHEALRRLSALADSRFVSAHHP